MKFMNLLFSGCFIKTFFPKDKSFGNNDLVRLNLIYDIHIKIKELGKSRPPT